MASAEEELIVMATYDEVAVTIARDILDNEGIRYRMSGGGLRKFGGTTFLGASLGPLMGQTFIKVPAYLARQASELLQGLSGVVPFEDIEPSASA